MVAVTDWQKVDKMAKLLRKKPRSVGELVALLGRSQRSVYRWLEMLPKRYPNEALLRFRTPGRAVTFVLAEREK